MSRYVRSWVAWQLAGSYCDASAALTTRPAGPTCLAYRIEGAAARLWESSTYQWNPRRSMQTDPMVNMLSVELHRTNRRSQISTHCSRVTHPHSRPREIDQSEQPAATKRIVGPCTLQKLVPHNSHDKLLLRNFGHIDGNGGVLAPGRATADVERRLRALPRSRAPVHLSSSHKGTPSFVALGRLQVHKYHELEKVSCSNFKRRGKIRVFVWKH